MLIWRWSSARAAAMLTLSLSAAARLRAWCVGRCALRTAAASSVYRLFAVRRTCRRVATGAGAIALAGVDMALRVRKGDVWDFVAVVGICVSHALRVGRGEKLESSLLSYKT